MPITIGSNIGSLKAQRRLADATSSLSSTYERLASGQRINKASDDAAGLAIASTLNSKAKVYSQAIRNINDGVSVFSIADAAVSSLTDINTRLQELAEQSANGVYSSKQRASMDAEAQALAKEYFRISRAAQFNQQRLFDGSMADGLRLQLGYGVDGSIHSSIGGNLGTGTVTLSMTMAAEGSSSYATALGDLNGDGILDLVTAGNGAGSGRATVRLGTGSGTFGVATSYQMDLGGSYAVTLGDLNGDGILDLVTAGYGVNSGQATIRLGTGSGTFGAATSYQMAGGVGFGVSLGDLNGDGILDLVTALGDRGGIAAVRLGLGNGTFGAASSYQMEEYSRAVSLGDLNGDGILDLVTAGTDYVTGTATVRLGIGNGKFGAATSYQMDLGDSDAVTLGDLNGDGILDLVTAGADGVIGTATVRLGLGNGTFGAASSYQMEEHSRAVSLGDLNGDGMLDLVTTGDSGFGTSATTSIRLGTGTGSFGAATSNSLAMAGNSPGRGITIGDLNGDGVGDLVASGYQNNGGISSGFAGILLGNSRNGIAPIQPFSLKTKADALQAMGLFSRTAKNLSDMRATLGASQSRLDAALGVVTVSRENFISASSRILDADIAQESAALARIQILQQAGAAVLAQSNLAPQLALKLLS